MNKSIDKFKDDPEKSIYLSDAAESLVDIIWVLWLKYIETFADDDVKRNNFIIVSYNRSK